MLMNLRNSNTNLMKENLDALLKCNTGEASQFDFEMDEREFSSVINGERSQSSSFE